jgi:hypothetical protein
VKEAMAAENKVDTVLIDMNLGDLGKVGRVQIASVIGQFAPKSTLYQTNASLKQAADDIIAAGADLDAKIKAKEAAKQTYLTAVGAEATSQRAFDNTAGVFKAQAQIFCKTAQDAQNLGCNRKVKRPKVALTGDLKIDAKPGADLGSILLHVTRIPGLEKYVAEISVNPMTATSWQPLPGTTARRKLLGLVSGQQYWIRFCTERGTDRSSWSEPVPVIAR